MNKNNEVELQLFSFFLTALVTVKSQSDIEPLPTKTIATSTSPTYPTVPPFVNKYRKGCGYFENSENFKDGSTKKLPEDYCGEFECTMRGRHFLFETLNNGKSDYFCCDAHEEVDKDRGECTLSEIKLKTQQKLCEYYNRVYDPNESACIYTKPLDTLCDFTRGDNLYFTIKPDIDNNVCIHLLFLNIKYEICDMMEFNDFYDEGCVDVKSLNDTSCDNSGKYKQEIIESNYQNHKYCHTYIPVDFEKFAYTDFEEFALSYRNITLDNPITTSKTIPTKYLVTSTTTTIPITSSTKTVSTTIPWVNRNKKGCYPAKTPSFFCNQDECDSHWRDFLYIDYGNGAIVNYCSDAHEVLVENKGCVSNDLKMKTVKSYCEERGAEYDPEESACVKIESLDDNPCESLENTDKEKTLRQLIDEENHVCKVYIRIVSSFTGKTIENTVVNNVLSIATASPQVELNSTKTIPTSTTKTVPIITSSTVMTTKTISTQCVPMTVTYTEQKFVTVTEKEYVTVTIKSEATNNDSKEN